MSDPSPRKERCVAFRVLPVILALLVALLPLGGCGGEEAVETVPVEPEESGVEEDVPAETPDSPPDLSGYGYEAHSGGTEEVMVLKDIRFGAHQERERVVLEFTPHLYDPHYGLPHYRVSYIPTPYVDAEGNRFPLEEPYLLEVRFNGNKADLSPPDGYVEVYLGPDAFSPSLPVIGHARLVPTYEHDSLILLIGLRHRVPFRVEELLDPPRLAIDVAET